MNTSGGPLVAAAAEYAKSWQGVEGSSIKEEMMDYERACDVNDYLETIPCGDGEALIFGDEPLQSAFFVVDGSLLLARWVHCDSYDLADSTIKNITFDKSENTSGIIFTKKHGGLIFSTPLFP